MQALEAADPEIGEVARHAIREQWRDDNKEQVKAWENFKQSDKEFRAKMRSMSPEELQKLIDVAAEMKAVQMSGGPPPAQQAQMAEQAAEQQAQMEAQRALVPPTSLPYQEKGPSPEVAPSQMAGTMTEAPQGMEASPEMIAMQMRRGRPQP